MPHRQQQAIDTAVAPANDVARIHPKFVQEGIEIVGHHLIGERIAGVY